MPGIGDWRNDPISTIDSLFDHDITNKQKVVDFFKEKTSEGHFIPTINETSLNKLVNGSLVRFRGMIQDQMEMECFVGGFEVRREGGATYQKISMYRDDLGGEKIDFNCPKNVHMDRNVFYAVPIPGETDWLKNAYIESHKTLSSNKRSFDEEMNTTNTKMMIDNDRVARTRGQGDQSTVENRYPLNLPFTDESGTPCVLKFYENNHYKVNEMIEVIGIVQFEEASKGNGEPANCVPRVHVILCSKIVYNNPLATHLSIEDVRSKSLDTMNMLIELFTKALLGDENTAQLLIYSLISSVHSRMDGRAMGKHTLNIVGVPQSSTFTHRLYALISRLVTMSHYYPLTVDSLNTMDFSPRKDYDHDCLLTGMLQICDGTVFMIDESKLTNGQLQTRGINGITALGSMVLNQKVEYDFKYHRTEFNCDLNVIVVSEAKSLFKCDSVSRLKRNSISEAEITTTYNEINAFLTDERLNDARIFFSRNRDLDFSISDVAKQTIENEFVNIRRQNRDDMTVDDFNSLLILLRLISKCAGVDSFRDDFWNTAKNTEHERKAALTSQP